MDPACAEGTAGAAFRPLSGMKGSLSFPEQQPAAFSLPAVAYIFKWSFSVFRPGVAAHSSTAHERATEHAPAHRTGRYQTCGDRSGDEAAQNAAYARAETKVFPAPAFLPSCDTACRGWNG